MAIYYHVNGFVGLLHIISLIFDWYNLTTMYASYKVKLLKNDLINKIISLSESSF